MPRRPAKQTTKIMERWIGPPHGPLKVVTSLVPRCLDTPDLLRQHTFAFRAGVSVAKAS